MFLFWNRKSSFFRHHFSFYSIHPIEAFSFRTYLSNDDQSDREHKYMALTVATRLKQATVEWKIGLPLFFSSSHLDQTPLFLLFPKIFSPLPSPFDNSTHYLSFTEVFIKDSFLTVSIFQLIQVVWIETGSTFDAIVEDVHKNIMTGVYIFLW